MQKYCKKCNHLCHCVGKGYNISISLCESCPCNTCTCVEKSLLLEKNIIVNKYKNIILSVIVSITVLLVLLGCTTKELYPNKMNTIAETLKKINL
jgi:hypothetical protein